MPYLVREATAADGKSLTPLIRAALQEQAQAAPHRYTPTPDFELQFRRWLGKLFEDPRSTVLIALPSPTADDPPSPSPHPPASPSPLSPLPPSPIPLGYLLASVQKSPPIFHPAEYALIHHLYVLPPHRRLGVADRLLSAAIQFYAALSIPQLRVETHAANTSARHFFESAGFHPSILSLTLPLPPPRQK